MAMRAGLAIVSAAIACSALAAEPEASAASPADAASAAAGSAASPQTVEVIGTAPLPGIGVEPDRLPYAIRTLRRDALDRQQAATLTEALARRLPGLIANDPQGNPFEPDLMFRGQRASGLLGSAQGMSVYLDGVRINEPFGDIVQWDLVPDFALADAVLVPGANPAFGLNTIGGALAFTTASGRDAPGVRAELQAGSFGRASAWASLGDADDDGWHRYLGLRAFDEDGWRDASPTRDLQAFAKFGRDDAERSIWLSLLAARSRLVGNGLTPAFTLGDDGERAPDLYATHRSAIYTAPDLTRNRLVQLTAHWTEAWGASGTLEFVAHLRRATRRGANGDVAGDDGADAGADAGANAVFNDSSLDQTAWGFAASASRRDGAHRWQVGADFELSEIDYSQSTRPAAFDAARRAVALGDEPAAVDATLDGRSRRLGIYATDTWALAATTDLTATLRLNDARVRNRLATLDDESGMLGEPAAETFDYRSANPALGIVHRLTPAWQLYANAARNARAPTAIELGCADPEAPCRLPGGLQSDPYLKQVRSNQFEAGLRWRPAARQALALALYRIDNHDDILFSSVGPTSQQGFFANFPRTRYQGGELQWQGRARTLEWQAALSRLEATYEAQGALRSGERNLEVHPGMRIAGLPRWAFAFGIDWQAAPGLSLGADLRAFSRRVARGNEDRRIADDDPGRIDLPVPGHAIVDLRAAWRLARGIEVVARVDNVFDRRVFNDAALGRTLFDAAGAYTGDARRALFVAPGAPRAAFAGLRLRY